MHGLVHLLFDALEGVRELYAHGCVGHEARGALVSHKMY